MARIFNPPHPGGILAEQLQYLGISEEDFARHLGVTPTSLNRIFKEKAPITADIALRISKVMPGPEASTWLLLQSDYDAWQAKNQERTSNVSNDL